MKSQEYINLFQKLTEKLQKEESEEGKKSIASEISDKMEEVSDYNSKSLAEITEKCEMIKRLSNLRLKTCLEIINVKALY